MAGEQELGRNGTIGPLRGGKPPARAADGLPVPGGAKAWRGNRQRGRPCWLNLPRARPRRRAGGHPRNMLRAPQSWCAQFARAARRASAPRPFL